MHRTRRIALSAAQGLLMGGADVIPGVSGGTVALVVGIYERLIAAIRTLATAPGDLLRDGPAAARARLREVEWMFIVPLGVGILTAIGVGALVIPDLIETFPVQTRAVFFGLILGSITVPWRRIAAPAGRSYALAAVAAVVAFVLVGIPPREVTDPGMMYVFGAAAVAICAMILPGVSGAFLLLVLGVYEATLRAASGLDLAYVGVFASGAIIGLAIFSKVLGALLDRRHDVTMAALVGLMAGSLRALWPWLGADRALQAPGDIGAALTGLALAAAGVAVVRLVVHLGSARAKLMPS